jgi:predicted unusual protein kinase regulating ubiquinone biosynthesis (AarF/ABC1/UbiB family)
MAKTRSLTNNDPETQQCLSTGLLVRSLALARLAFATSGDLWSIGGGNKLREGLDCPPEKRAELQSKLEEQAAEITRELGSLKGSVMKVGQLLSMYGEYFLPPQVNKILKCLQASTPPLDWVTIEPYLKKLLAEKYDEIEVDPKAIAAASIGQVHKAKVKKTGKTIALKIQYPGVERAINSDMKALKAIIMFAPGLPRGSKVDELVCEIEEMLAREIDYSLEATYGEKFRELLKNDPRFLVPEIHREWSNSKVLAVQMICGYRIDDEKLQTISQDRRNALAESLLDLYLKELFEVGCVQTDPHIGNYRIRLKGEATCDGGHNDRDCVVLLDFGAVREFDPVFLRNYRALIRASLDRQPQAVTQAGLDLGFLRSCDGPNVTAAFYDFCRLVIEPFDPQGAGPEGKKYFDSDGSYDWRNNDLPCRLAAQLKEVIRARELRAPPREALFLDRKSTGLYILLSSLGAKTNTYEKLARAVR